MSKIRKCPICGGDVIGDYCFSCGYKLPEEEKIAAKNNPEPARTNTSNSEFRGGEVYPGGAANPQNTPQEFAGTHSNTNANLRHSGSRSGGSASQEGVWHSGSGSSESVSQEGVWHSGSRPRESIYGTPGASQGYKPGANPGSNPNYSRRPNQNYGYAGPSSGGFTPEPEQNYTNSNNSNYAYTDTAYTETANPEDYPKIRVTGVGSNSRSYSRRTHDRQNQNYDYRYDGANAGNGTQSRFKRFTERYARMTFGEKLRKYWWYILLVLFGFMFIPLITGIITFASQSSHPDRSTRKFAVEQLILAAIGLLLLIFHV
jgi:hypothetical protein